VEVECLACLAWVELDVEKDEHDLMVSLALGGAWLFGTICWRWEIIALRGVGNLCHVKGHESIHFGRMHLETQLLQISAWNVCISK